MSIDIWEKSVARDGYTPLIPAVDVIPFFKNSYS
jgi:hypothetical protein